LEKKVGPLTGSKEKVGNKLGKEKKGLTQGEKKLTPLDKTGMST